MLVDIKNLSFQYKNAKEPTIKNFSYEIKQNEIIAILGESGSGKSTILRLIAGLEKPNKGKIAVDNTTLVNEQQFIEPEDRNIGMVFQDYALFPHMAIEKNIAFGLKKWSKSSKEKRVHEVLELVQMTEYKKRYPHELSGGQQQRIALARALAPNPKLLLLDEPFSNLDANLQVSIREQLKVILKKTHITTVLVTHDIEDVKSIADQIIVLKEGEIYKSVRPSEGLDHDIYL